MYLPCACSSPAFCLPSHADRGIAALLLIYTRSDVTEDSKRWGCLYFFFLFRLPSCQAGIFSLPTMAKTEFLVSRRSPGEERSPQRGLLLPGATLHTACRWAVKLSCGPQLPHCTPRSCPVLSWAHVDKRSEAFRKRKCLCPSAPRSILSPSLCPSVTSQSRSSTARSERAEHAFVHSLIILNS